LILFVILVSIAAVVLVFAVVQIITMSKSKAPTGNRVKTVWDAQQFYQKAMIAGFTLQEATLLREFTLAAKLENPQEVLWSYKSLDIVIKFVAENFRIAEKEKNPEAQEFLGKLLDLRKKIIVDKLNARKKLSSSKEIPAGQEVQVVLTGIGIFSTKTSSNDLYFAVLSPIVLDLPPNFKWDDRKVMVFFRKRNEGEYSFNTTAVREIEDPKTGDFVLLLHHQHTLSHTQHRQSVRVLLNKRAHLYPVGGSTERNFAEGKPCELYDISDDGCSVIVDGKINASRTVIIQFTLGNQVVGINGKCRSAQYNRLKNVTFLHIHAVSIPRDVKNTILSVMFGLVSKDDEQPLPNVHSESNGNAESQNYPNDGIEKPAAFHPEQGGLSSDEAVSKKTTPLPELHSG
jgi:hypothetical protein